MASDATKTAASPVSRALCAIRTITSRVGATRSTENVLAKAIHHRIFAHPEQMSGVSGGSLSFAWLSIAVINWGLVPDARRTVCRLASNTDVTVTQPSALGRASISAASPDPHSGQEFLS